MIKKLIFLTVLFSALFINAQTDPFYVGYDWDKAVFENFDKAKYKDKDIVVINEKQVNEFAFNNERQLVEYKLIHNIYWLNSNDKIEDYNKVYLPIYSENQLLKNKARVVTSSGKIIEIDDSKILEATDNVTNTSYKYFALEGIDKGSFIEYFYVVQQFPKYTGEFKTLQGADFKEQVEFDVYTPENLILATKSYNGLSEMTRDTTLTAKNRWYLKEQNIEAVISEKMAAYKPNLKKVVYKFDKNLYAQDKEIISYGIIAQNVYSSLNSEIDKKSDKKIKKVIADLKLEGDDLETKIRKIESYIKTNILLEKFNQPTTLAAVIETKVSNKDNLLRLYTALLKIVEAKYEVVLTTNRYLNDFDKEFESYNFLQEYLMYFPSLDLYLEPLGYDSRLGFPSGNLTDNYGLFIKELNIGGFSSGLGEVKYIEPVNYDKTTYDLTMDVSFDENNMSKIAVDMLREMKGYYAISYESYLHFMKDEQIKELKKSIVESVNKNFTILSSDIEFSKPEEMGKTPLVLKAKLESEEFVQNAGNKYLFKLGDLIGPQSELYQENERKLPVSSEYERSYKNILNVKIPEGYSFKNLEDINISESYSENGDTLFSFISNYTIENNTLKVVIDEFYNRNKVGLKNFESYRKVINSAANFNKIVLVLTK